MSNGEGHSSRLVALYLEIFQIRLRFKWRGSKSCKRIGCKENYLTCRHLMMAQFATSVTRWVDWVC